MCALIKNQCVKLIIKTIRLHVAIRLSIQRASNSSPMYFYTPPWRYAQASRQQNRPHVAARTHDNSLHHSISTYWHTPPRYRASRTNYMVVMGMQPFDAALEPCTLGDVLEFTKSAKSLQSLHWAHQNIHTHRWRQRRLPIVAHRITELQQMRIRTRSKSYPQNLSLPSHWRCLALTYSAAPRGSNLSTATERRVNH